MKWQKMKSGKNQYCELIETERGVDFVLGRVDSEVVAEKITEAVNAHGALVAENARLREALQLVSSAEYVNGNYQICEYYMGRVRTALSDRHE